MDSIDQINILQAISSATCEDMSLLLKSVNSSLYESKNMTLEAYTALLLGPYCTPKKYHGVQGVKKWIISTILISFLICGLIGNILSATVMFRRSRRGISSYFYLASSAVMDICVLYSGCLLASTFLTVGE